jgi:ribonuclease R
MMQIDRDKIFEFFREHPEKPWHIQDIQRHLKVDDRNELRRELNTLTEEGRLIRTRRRTYGLPQEMNLLIGRLQVTAGGYGFVIMEEEGSKDLFIPADLLAGAWDGDKVIARPSPLKSDPDRPSGEIVRVLERKHDRLVGTLEYARGYAILRPDSPRLRERILLLPESVDKLEAGSRIVAKMVWPEQSGEKDPFGEVEEFLGAEDDPEVETRAVIVKHDLRDEFEPATIAEAKAVPPTVTGEMMEGRTDLRGVPTFTIDGADAKDFDDAISLERVKGEGKNGLLRVGIHIADVSYYVAEGTSLDREAKERATSVYLPGKVLPMLPEELSNGICSLVEGEARLALSVLVDMTREGEVQGVKFKETVIQSDARLTYEQVQEFADGGRLPVGKRKLERDIKVLLGITQKLREERLGGGALDFDFTEAKVDVDEAGALHLMPVKSNTARQLIEELMLLANRLVAQDLHKRDIPALYRVHEDPSAEKIGALQRALGKLGYEIDLEHAGPNDLQNILKQVAGKPEAQLVNTLLLRSLKQARYSAENLGHFGLAFENYLHFTSPIRRYPDLVVHRVLRLALQRRLSPTLKERFKSDFPELAVHVSERERVAEEAERDLTRYYHAKWARDHLGEVFNGTITGVTNFGIFAALPNGVEGLIHVSHLDDDYYTYLEDSMMLIGKHTRKKFRLGDRISVKIMTATPTSRQIDLIPGHMEMPEESEVDERPMRESIPKTLKTPLRAARPVEDERPERKAGGGTQAETRAPARATGGTGLQRPASSNTQPQKRVEVPLQRAQPAQDDAPQAQGAQAEAREAPRRERQPDARTAPQAGPQQEQVVQAPPQEQATADERPRRKRRRLVFAKAYAED